VIRELKSSQRKTLIHIAPSGHSVLRGHLRWRAGLSSSVDLSLHEGKANYISNGAGRKDVVNDHESIMNRRNHLNALLSGQTGGSPHHLGAIPLHREIS
jgi:hypothetical protein